MNPTKSTFVPFLFWLYSHYSRVHEKLTNSLVRLLSRFITHVQKKKWNTKQGTLMRPPNSPLRGVDRREARELNLLRYKMTDWAMLCYMLCYAMLCVCVCVFECAILGNEGRRSAGRRSDDRTTLSVWRKKAASSFPRLSKNEAKNYPSVFSVCTCTVNIG